MADDPSDKSQPSNVVMVARPPATITADPAVVNVDVKSKPNPNTETIMTVRNYNTVTVVSGGLSGAFAATIALTFAGATIGLIPLWGIEWIARYWGIWCLVYVMFEVLPMLIAMNMSDASFKIDRYTSWMPLVITLVMMAIFLVKPPAVSDLWIVAVESLLASVIDLMLVYAIVRVRHHVAILVVEARRREGPKEVKTETTEVKKSA